MFEFLLPRKELFTSDLGTSVVVARELHCLLCTSTYMQPQQKKKAQTTKKQKQTWTVENAKKKQKKQ